MELASPSRDSSSFHLLPMPAAATFPNPAKTFPAKPFLRREAPATAEGSRGRQLRCFRAAFTPAVLLLPRPPSSFSGCSSGRSHHVSGEVLSCLSSTVESSKRQVRFVVHSGATHLLLPPALPQLLRLPTALIRVFPRRQRKPATTGCFSVRELPRSATSVGLRPYRLVVFTGCCDSFPAMPLPSATMAMVAVGGDRFPEHPSLCHLESWFESYNRFNTAAQKLYTVTNAKLSSDVGCAGRKSGPEQTRILPGFTVVHILMLLSICVVAEFAEERKEDVDGVRRLGFRVLYLEWIVCVRITCYHLTLHCIRYTECECGLSYTLTHVATQNSVVQQKEAMASMGVDSDYVSSEQVKHKRISTCFK
ncbi:hypothetical protein LXL04_016569 [Taraxacum kok-saghyz]